MDSSARFQFGENWNNFLSVIDESHIAEAIARLSDSLGDISGKTFLDVGSGSGIHSLAAIRLGASRVFSFDYDPKSVSCTNEMKRRYAPDSPWTIQQGSALDEAYMRSLGKFDIVYAWGVLHHTGDMWKALTLLPSLTNDIIFVSIYNDQGDKSKFWRKFKERYNQSSSTIKRLYELIVLAWAWGKPFCREPLTTARNWRNYRKERGMSPWYDVVDWAGGYPFEVATPQAIEDHFAKFGFLTKQRILRDGIACNEFVFKLRPH